MENYAVDCDVEESTPVSTASTTGLTLSFHDVYYSARVKNPGLSCGCASKEVLNGMSGIFKPGMNAIMGPTGSGKTTLLDVMAGRKDHNGLWGNVMIDGRKQPRNFKNMSGYVVQDDIVMGSMTVKENLMFSANMRLPKTVSHKEKKARVDQAIDELGLEHCQNTRVGSTFIRGVSGGERKRTNIGMELVISPQLLFLDEPTTGLDATVAYSLMALLRGLSQNGRTVIFAIHQPRYAIFKLFDQLMLIDTGRTVYHGPASEALDFFSGNGYECEPHDNPPDFFLDVIGGMHDGDTSPPASQRIPFEIAQESSSETSLKSLSSTPVATYGTTTKKNGTQRRKEARSHRLADLFERSRWYKESLKQTFKYVRFKENEPVASDEVPPPGPKYSTSFPVQCMYLSKRTLINLYRFPLAALIQWTVLILFGVVTGAVYFDMDTSFPSGVQNRIGAFFFLSINLTFACAAVLELFINERVLFVHENVSGYYSVSSYFLAKVFCDIIPMRVIPMVPVSLITYYMFDLQQETSKILFYMLVVILTSCCGAAVGFLVSGRFNSVGLATLVTYLIFVVMMVYGGVLINVSDIPVWLRWGQYLSITSYSVKAMSINELYGMKFCGPVEILNTEINYCYKGKSWLKLQGIDAETDWDLWQNVLGLVMLFVGFLLLAFIQLHRLNKLS